MRCNDDIDRRIYQSIECLAATGGAMHCIAVTKARTEAIQGVLLAMQQQYLSFVFVQRHFVFSKVLCRIARAVLALWKYSLGVCLDCRVGATGCAICDAAHSESAGYVTFAQIQDSEYAAEQRHCWACVAMIRLLKM